MSRWHVERAIFLLGRENPLTRLHADPGAALWALIEQVRSENDEDPTAPTPVFDLDEDEVALIAGADLVGMYRMGVHPVLIRAFAGTWGIDYVAEYRRAGL
ncbi:MAG: hypothetical protein M3022_10610 [Actinomycetota bacterium]|nr:hypothetical protein [Actinomycetota bacterium]